MILTDGGVYDNMGDQWASGFVDRVKACDKLGPGRSQALGIQSKSLLLEVLKAGSEEEMIRLLEEVSSHGLNRDDLRRRLRNRDRAGSRSSRRTPYSFKFKAPDKSYTLNLTFRQSEVEKQDLIQALEQILTELRSPEA
jgi:hypothetical protein